MDYKKLGNIGFDWHRRHYDDGRFVRSAAAAITAAIILILAISSGRERPADGFCDVRTTSCYDRLAVPLRGSGRP